MIASPQTTLSSYGKTAHSRSHNHPFCRLPHGRFDECVDADFEYLCVKIPAKTNKILTRSYGDWRTPVKSGFSWHEWMKFDTERDYKTVLIEDFGYKKSSCRLGRTAQPCGLGVERRGAWRQEGASGSGNSHWFPISGG